LESIESRCGVAQRALHAAVGSVSSHLVEWEIRSYESRMLLPMPILYEGHSPPRMRLSWRSWNNDSTPVPRSPSSVAFALIWVIAIATVSFMDFRYRRNVAPPISRDSICFAGISMKLVLFALDHECGIRCLPDRCAHARPAALGGWVSPVPTCSKFCEFNLVPVSHTGSIRCVRNHA